MTSSYNLLTEKVYYRSPSNNIITKATILKTFEIEHFKRSLTELQRVFPTLSCLVLEDDKGFRFEHREGLTIPYDIRQKSKEDEWKAIIREYDSIPYRFNEKPGLNFVVLQEQNRFELIIVGSHLIGDGMSYVYLWNAFVEIYCNNKFHELAVQEPRFISGYDDIPKTANISLIKKKIIQIINSMVQKNLIHYTQEDYEDMVKQCRSRSNRNIITWKFTENELNRVTSLCKVHGVSLNSAFATALLASERKFLKDSNSKTKIAMAVNLRSRFNFNPGTGLGNYASGLNCKIRYNQKLDFWSNAQKINQYLKACISNDKKMFEFVHSMLELNGNLFVNLHLSRLERKKNDAMLKKVNRLGLLSTDGGFEFSNLGIIEMNPQYVKDFNFLLPTSEVYTIAFSAVTTSESSYVNIQYKDSIHEDKVMNDMLDYMKMLLTNNELEVVLV